MPRITTIAAPVAHLVGPGKLKVVNGFLAFSAEGQSPLRLEPTTLRRLFCFGDVGVTDAALELLFAHEVEVAWLTPAGQRCRGRLVRSDPSTTSVRLLQYQVMAQPVWRLQLAQAIVAAKIESMTQAARHHQRHGSVEATTTLAQLENATASCAAAVGMDALRGIEGSASAAWFGLFGRLLQPPWQFDRRARRPPPDPVNALLSLGYTWLLTRTVARCEAFGLEVYLGALHEYRAGRASLACDQMEPLRTPAVDRWVLPLLNCGELTPADFVAGENGFRLQPATFGRTLHNWENHWQQNGLDEMLDRQLTELIAVFRQAGSLPPEGAPVL